MKKLTLSVLFGSLVFPYSATAEMWENECVGYYQLQLPSNLEVALYPIEDFVNPRKQPENDGDIKTRIYASPKITFGKKPNIHDNDSVQAQFTKFEYGKYELGISSESPALINFPTYIERVKGSIDFWNNVKKQYEALDFRISKKPVMPKAEFNRRYGYLIKEYPDAFTVYESRGYTVYLNKDNHLYHFWEDFQKENGDKSLTAEKQLRDSEPEVLSLLNRFHTRKLYEVPIGQGFCMPYGFIAGDSGHEKRNMGVTYRLKKHPDVTIFFQDFGTNGEILTDKESMKDAVTSMWNSDYLMGASKKELLSPKWHAIKMDGRDGLGTFVKGTYSNVPVYDYKGHVSKRLNYTNYAYLAYVRGNKESRDKEPDLLLYVSQDSEQAKDIPPMDKDELKKLAEHIVSSVKRR